MVDINQAEAYWFLKNYTTAPLLDETANNHDSDAITNALLRAFTATKYIYAPDIATNHLSTPDHADFDITGTIEVRGWGSIRNVATGADEYCAGKYDATGGERSWIAAVPGVGGTPKFYWSTNGTNLLSETSSATLASVGISNDEEFGWRITMEIDDGAVNFYYRQDSVTNIESDSGWTQLGNADISTAAGSNGAATSINSGSADQVIAGHSAAGSPIGNYAGTMVRVIICNGLGFSNKVSDFDARDWATTDIENGTWADGDGHTYTIVQAGTAELLHLVDRQTFWHDTNALITIPDAAALDFTHTDSFTWGIAFRTYDTSPAADAVLMAKKTNLTTGDGYAGYLESANATAKGVVSDGANTQTATSGNLTAGKAHTLIWVYDGSVIQTYLDGVSSGAASADNVSADMANASKLTFGSISGGGSYNQFEWWAACVVPQEVTDLVTLHTQLLDQSTTPAAGSPGAPVGWGFVRMGG